MHSDADACQDRRDSSLGGTGRGPSAAVAIGRKRCHVVKLWATLLSGGATRGRRDTWAWASWPAIAVRASISRSPQ
jgi:hypothetical protein